MNGYGAFRANSPWPYTTFRIKPTPTLKRAYAQLGHRIEPITILRGPWRK